MVAIIPEITPEVETIPEPALEPATTLELAIMLDRVAIRLSKT